MALSSRFESLGSGAWFDPNGTYWFESINVGRNSNLGLRRTLVARRSKIRIGDNVMLGPEVTIRGGNHRIDVVDKPMIAVTDREKRPSDDRGVVIEDDVWVATRAIILHGVTVRRVSVVGAGAVVTSSIVPCGIAVGSRAKAVGYRFTVDQMLRHQSALYSLQLRLSRSLCRAVESAWRLTYRAPLRPSVGPAVAGLRGVSHPHWSAGALG